MAVDQMESKPDGNRAWGNDWRSLVAFYNLLVDKGDLVVAGASARLRLPPGSRGQVLTVDPDVAAGLSYGAGGALLPINNQTGNYTAVLADLGKLVQFSTASPATFTIPPNGSVAFPVTGLVGWRQVGAGQITVAAGAGVTLRTPASLTTRTQYSELWAHQVAVNEWVISGDMS